MDGRAEGGANGASVHDDFRGYVLTQKGEAHCFEPGKASTVLVDRERGRPLRKLELRSEDGRLLKPTGTEVRKRGRA